MKRLENFKAKGKLGDILFTFNHDNFLSWLIWKISIFGINIKNREKKVSHVAIYLHDGLIVEMHFGGMRIVNAEVYDKKKFDLFWARPKKKFESFPMYRYVYGRIGLTKYSFSQIFIIALKKLLWLDKIKDVDRDSMECIEFLMNSFIEVGIKICPGKKPWEATPFDLYNSKEIEFIKL
jgi:hypothetical protein